ncbi:hypothetical protein HY745_04885 [Candidatus Desantisbacteria bacterium]|nr:hypothetical protein [Candidatus Desantisbacteria bacterium]
MLKNFIKHFQNTTCGYLSCETCRYCDRIAEKAVRTDKKLSKQLVTAYEKTLDSFISR